VAGGKGRRGHWRYTPQTTSLGHSIEKREEADEAYFLEKLPLYL